MTKDLHVATVLGIHQELLIETRARPAPEGLPFKKFSFPLRMFSKHGKNEPWRLGQVEQNITFLPRFATAPKCKCNRVGGCMPASFPGPVLIADCKHSSKNDYFQLSSNDGKWWFMKWGTQKRSSPPLWSYSTGNPIVETRENGLRTPCLNSNLSTLKHVQFSKMPSFEGPYTV